MSVLNEVKRVEIQAVKGRYENCHNAPSHHICQFLGMCQRYPLECKIYSSISHGSFVMLTSVHTTKKFQSLTLDWDESKVTDKEVLNLLTLLPDWNWKEPVFISMTRKELREKVRSILETDKLIGKSLRFQTFVEGTLYTLEKRLPKVRVPQGFVLSSLQPKHFSFVFKRWSDQCFEHENTYKKLLKFLPSVAIFKKNEEKGTSEGFPVSWIMQYHYGSIGMIYTVPEMRRKGLATVCMSSLLSQIEKGNEKPSIMINYDNDISVEYHTKLGYEAKYDLGWYMYIPQHCTSLQEFLNDE